ncbi:hypothetical protein F5878DRAFT_647159 [Lentinula raphanica]|uniref:DUF6533 domain-containing protein n=1 Tax=Lentinula raphanica TaxID=153919 RepID=A0AA38NWL7_9AGAR|nr:hypothetical protein F5878DRAFT_647159 [Lentinula raphanica]
MSSSSAPPAGIAALEPTLITIGYDLLATKRYWVAITALWAYEYLLTVGDEVRYAWKGKGTKNTMRCIIFWLFFLNRYLCLIIIVITNVAYFTLLFTQEICYRYGFVEQLETLFMVTIVEVLVLLRVYALSGHKQYVLFIAIPLITVQWALLLYQDVLYKDGTSNLGVLLFARELDTSAIPPLPDIDAYKLCLAIPSTEIVRAGETFLSLCIVYDGLAVLSIVYFVSQQAKGFHLAPIIELVQRDGLLYFAVMFSSNFVWLMMALHARPSLGFIQNQPAMVIWSIAVNRITMNLQRTSEEKIEFNSWTGGHRGFDTEIESTLEHDIELE